MLTNMKVERVGKTLVITVLDIDARTTKENRKVASIATSHGFHSIEGTGIAVNCNVSYNPKYDTAVKVESVMDFSKLSTAQQAAIAKILSK